MTRYRPRAVINPAELEADRGRSLEAQIRELQSQTGSPPRRHGGKWTRASQAVATSTPTLVSFTVEVDDTESWATVPFTTLTVPLAGLYAVSASASALGAPGTAGTLRITTGSENHDASSNGWAGTASLGIVTYLAAGTGISVTVFHATGVSQNVAARLEVHRLAA